MAFPVWEPVLEAPPRPRRSPHVPRAPLAGGEAEARRESQGATPSEAGPQRPRIDSVDLLRGAVMVLMVLDHLRDFLGGGTNMNPRDVNDPALFLTRWVTHFCAPTFVFLAGLSAFLYGSRPGRTTRDVSRFLLTRGAWLVVLELTVVNFGWNFDPTFGFLVIQVVWAIGWSMVALAGLVFLPRAAVAAAALAMIAGHNLLDGVRASQFGAGAWAWNLLHEPAMLRGPGGVTIFLLYPLIPWVGVMAAGYALGPVMQLDARRRRLALLGLGAAACSLFVALRAAGTYGDPAPAAAHQSPLATALAFLDCEKYPPSLLYLAITLGPALAALALLESARGRLAGVLVTLGRVPFFFYLMHIYMIHLLAVAVALAGAAAGGGAGVGWLFDAPLVNKPPGFGFPLPVVYALWLAVVAVLYPPCRWLAGVKRRRKERWLSYL